MKRVFVGGTGVVGIGGLRRVRMGMRMRSRIAMERDREKEMTMRRMMEMRRRWEIATMRMKKAVIGHEDCRDTEQTYEAVTK
jgi:hypothetical protein